MLPNAVPHARIMVFQYSTMASSLSQNVEANERLVQIAQELLHDLGEKRQDAASRPIIFIGHGFGGIIIERALVLAGEEERRDILDSTLGLVFLGTPFRGSEAAVRRAELEDSKRLSKFITTLNTQGRRFLNQKLDPTPRHVRRLAALQLFSPTFGVGSSRRRGGNEPPLPLSTALSVSYLLSTLHPSFRMCIVCFVSSS
jgi:pimeloyl-ACP methyl ester carboxylesterase